MRLLHKLALAFILFGSFSGHGQSVSIDSPQPGDTLGIGDTVNFRYSYDSAWFAIAKDYGGVVLMLSPDGGDHFFNLYPIETQVPNDLPISTIYFGAEYEGDVNVVIPAQVTQRFSGEMITLPTESNDVYLAIQPYQASHLISIMEPSLVIRSKPLSINNFRQRNPFSYRLSPADQPFDATGRGSGAQEQYFSLSGRKINRIKSDCSMEAGGSGLYITQCIAENRARDYRILLNP